MTTLMQTEYAGVDKEAELAVDPRPIRAGIESIDRLTTDLGGLR